MSEQKQPIARVTCNAEEALLAAGCCGFPSVLGCLFLFIWGLKWIEVL